MTSVFLDTNVTKLYYFPSFKYLHLVLKENVDYSLEAVTADFLTINNLKKDESIYVLLDMNDISFEHIPKEVMDFMANSEYKKYHIKIALIASGLGQKLVGNFYLKMFKPEANTKLFTSVKNAFKWFDFEDQETKLKELDRALQHNR